MSSKLSSPKDRSDSTKSPAALQVRRRDALKKMRAATALLGLQAALSEAEPAGSAKKRPHIFLIMADHLKASATSLHGNRFAPTLERLAAQGVTFNHAYAQATICTPSRASIDLVNDALELRDLLKGGQAPSGPVRELTRLLDQWEERCAAHFQALGVQPGKRNFDEPVPVSTGEDHWKPNIFLDGHRPADASHRVPLKD